MKTFKQAYDILATHAQTLREQAEPNIDDLLRIVNESVEAYKVCQARIAAVDEALQAALGSTAQAASEGLDTGAAPEAGRAVTGRPAPARKAEPADQGPFGMPDDEIPF